MPTKRRRLALDGDQPTALPCISLTSLPIEILAEILFHTRSPSTVLALSRTCSFLYHSLALNPDASFIWRGVRRTCRPVPLPDPGDGWKKSEADYVAFVFSGGVCEVCRKATRDMYVSFAARIRLCGNWHCRRRFLDEILVNVTPELKGQDRQSLWVPPVESTRCFYYLKLTAPSWPRGELFLRKSDWAEFQRQLQVYKDAEQAQAEYKEDQQTKLVLERYHAAKQRLPQIMKISINLVQWKWCYDWEYKEVKRKNDSWTKTLAESEGWDLGDLVASQTYGSLQRRKNLLLERVTLDDVVPIRPTIESELLAMRARHQRQKSEAAYKERVTEIKKIYERMRCGTLRAGNSESSNSSEPPVLPPLSVFLTLPSVCALRGSPDPSAIPPSSVSVPSGTDSSLAISLITADVHTWAVPVQKHLMTLLGYPNGWQSASAHVVHPLKRITARFFCRRCGEGNVGKGYQRERCLDFKGVCSHICAGTPIKSAKGSDQEVPQENVTGTKTGDGNGKEKGKGGKRLGGGKTTDWTVKVFERDEKAISFIRSNLNRVGLVEEHPHAAATAGALDCILRCMVCQGWIVMDFATAIGHAHRHESMKIQASAGVPSQAGLFEKDASAPNGDVHCPFPPSQLAFERDRAELLLGRSHRARALCKKVNYGCKHCLVVVNGIVVGMEKPGNKGLRAMSFNGLRSHVKEKHGIRDIGDEDFFCYTSIQGGGGNEEG